MANQVYGYATTYGGGGLSTVYTSRIGGGSSGGDAYLSDPSLMASSRYLTSDTLSSSDPLLFSSSRIAGAPVTTTPFSQATWPVADGSLDPSFKRPVEALYHQTLLGTHNAFGQSEALFSSNALAKRPRYESASNLPIYPQRPGEKDCAYYMLTRTCKFGDSCKFDHPIWVPEGGIPDWKEVPFAPAIESLPERPGEPDCPYFLKTQRCKFGLKCKFNHPKDSIQIASSDVEGASETSVLPDRPSEPPCSYYMKTGKCKFGATCRFHHPKDIQILSAEQNAGSGDQSELASETAAGDAKSKAFLPVTPALMHNSKGLPIRPGEVDCPFYLKTGSCKYGATCRYNHPDRNAIYPVAGVLGHSIVPTPAANLPIGVINSAASLIPNIDPRLAPAAIGVAPKVYPQRPGQMECDFYMKTGECKFGERCKFHHPIDRSAPTVVMKQQNVKLTLAGLPRREGAVHCPFYMKTGTCKYGVTCKFDHPPPGEVISITSGQGSSGGEVNEAENGNAIAEVQAAMAVQQ